MKFWLDILWRILFVVILGFLAAYWYYTPDKVFMETYDLEMPKLEDEQNNNNDDTINSTTKDLESKVELENVNNKSLPKDKKIIENVPFVVQAPSSQWKVENYKNASEEASMLMANLWLENKKSPSKSETEAILEKLFLSEKSFFGNASNISILDTAKFFQQYFKHEASVIEDASLFDLYNVLAEGGIIIAPFDGKKLNNSNFSGNNLEQHMLVIIGYDLESKEFIVNDPGFEKGENYLYSSDLLYNAIRDYKTGNNEPISVIRKNVIVIRK